VILCVDVDYRTSCAVAAAVGVAAWSDADAMLERAVRVDGPPLAYEPGAFYRRELPPLVALLDELGALDARAAEPAVIVVDGYVWLGEGRPGLGAHLYEVRGGRTPVVGVAKEAFHGNSVALPVLRGASQRPLFVTSIGLEPRDAAAEVLRMHGAGRIPTMLRLVDRLARAATST
jgi:deoxyribonuclease V